MKHESFRIALFLPLVAAFLSFVPSGSLMAADTIEVGVAGADRGDLASYGLPTIKAAEMVVKEINAKGGVLGRQVQLFVEDNVCKPEVATNTAEKLVSKAVNAFGVPRS
jgi:branched-chain amino acid transport system substrate-binding protein